VKFDNSKIKLIKSDSTEVKFTTEYDEFNQKLYLDFKKETSEKYSFKIFPSAFTDFFESTNDTLSYQISTKKIEDYGNLKVKLENVKHYPVILELIDFRGEALASEYIESNNEINFNLLNPAVYNLRIIYDDNKNKKYDPGNYLEKNYAEEVIYLSKEIDVRANWDIEQVFDVSIPYTPPLKKKVEQKPKKKSSF